MKALLFFLVSLALNSAYAESACFKAVLDYDSSFQEAVNIIRPEMTGAVVSKLDDNIRFAVGLRESVKPVEVVPVEVTKAFLDKAGEDKTKLSQIQGRLSGNLLLSEQTYNSVASCLAREHNNQCIDSVNAISNNLKKYQNFIKEGVQTLTEANGQFEVLTQKVLKSYQDNIPLESSSFEDLISYSTRERSRQLGLLDDSSYVMPIFNDFQATKKCLNSL